MRFKAILFDLDGTLIETIHLYGEAYMTTFQKRGVDMTHEQFRSAYSLGGGIEETFRKLGGAQSSAFGIREERDALYIDFLRKRTRFLDGAEELLAMTLETPRAIVTGSWQTYVDAIDEKLGINNHFPIVITQDHMEPFHKPHPHGFLLAADRLGVEPKDCLVIGDQTFDIDAAIAAGMQSCLVWTDYTPAHAEGKADLEARSLREVMRHLG